MLEWLVCALGERPEQGAAVRGRKPRLLNTMMSRIALGPRAGQKVLTVQGAMPRAMVFDRTLCTDVDGLSLHAVPPYRATSLTRRSARDPLVCGQPGSGLRLLRLRLAEATSERLMREADIDETCV
jgi:hypothetical protein